MASDGCFTGPAWNNAEDIRCALDQAMNDQKDCIVAKKTEAMDVEMGDEQKKLACQKKEEGNKLYAKQQYKEAAALYSEAIQLDPQCAAYHGNRSAAYMMLFKYQDALDDAKKSTSLDPSYCKGYIREAKCHTTLGAFTSTLDCLQKVEKIEPNNKQADAERKVVQAMLQYDSAAKEAMKKKDFRKVEFCIRKLLSHASGALKYKCLQAEALCWLGKYDDAQILINDVLRADCSMLDAIYVKGLCLYYQDQTEKAFRILQQLLRSAPDFDKAKDTFKKAKLLESTKAAGNEAFKTMKYKEAHGLYTKALAIDERNRSTNAKLYNNRAMTKCKLGQLQDAVDDCTKAIELQPDYLKAMLRRAKCYMDLELYEEAVRDYEAVCKIDKSIDNKHLLKNAKLELKKSKRKDYYKILGASRSASQDEIKKAYKREALKHHPDRHSHATDAERKVEEQKFKEIGEAYSVLSDETKKMRYDSGQDLDGGMCDMNAEFDPNIIFQSFFGGGGQSGFNFGHGGGGRGGPQGGFPGGFSFSFG